MHSSAVPCSPRGLYTWNPKVEQAEVTAEEEGSPSLEYLFPLKLSCVYQWDTDGISYVESQGREHPVC